MIKPQEIKVPEFSKGLMGYNPAAVDQFISELVGYYTELYKEYTETEQKLNAVVEKYKQVSARASEALSGVRQMSEAIIADAQEEGEKIIEEANAKAEIARTAMKESCAEVLREYSETYAKENEKLASLEERLDAFKKLVLEAFKKQISDIEENFPVMDPEKLRSATFESQVEDTFKAKLEGGTDGE